MSPQPAQRLWDKRTLQSAAISVAVTSVLALSVCAFRGQLDTSAQPTSNSVSQSPTANPTDPCQKG